MRTCALLAASAFSAFSAVLLLAGCGGGNDTASSPPPKAPVKITLASPAFKDGAMLPPLFTCDGPGDSPPLAWFGVPRGAKELALILEDPDASGGTFVHWTVWGITPKANGLQEATPTGALQQGKNSFGDTKYGPPCPPKGDSPHRYEFTLYALSEPLNVGNGASADDVHAALATAAIAQGGLTARYAR